MAWRGLIEEYREHLPVSASTQVITLLEGDTPLLEAPRISQRVGARVLLKIEGANPTGSFKDRGMTTKREPRPWSVPRRGTPPPRQRRMQRVRG